MGILRIDILGEGPGAADLARLDEAVLALPPGAPVTFLVHGYRYEPGHAAHDPHRHIFSSEPGGAGRSLSWVRHLGFRGAEGQGGLAVALGWRARGTIWQAHRATAGASAALAGLLGRVALVSPGRRCGAMGHSLGARVILGALPLAAPGSLSRAVLLSAAAFRGETLAAVDTLAGRVCEFVNVTSRENDLFDFIMEVLVAGGARASIGLGIGRTVANWVDVQLDDPRVLDALEGMGFPVHPPAGRVCHWSSFRRPGVFALYRALLTDPEPLPFARLAARLPERQWARWSRLLAPLRPTLPLANGRTPV
ncbi:MAG: hypothetical protein ACKVPY_17140 [Paracoccaceae bacterium]